MALESHWLTALWILSRTMAMVFAVQSQEQPQPFWISFYVRCKILDSTRHSLGPTKISLRLRQYAKYGQMRESSYVTGTLAGPFVQGSRLHVDPILKENTNP